MTLYKNKYRIESTRLKNWDYSDNGHYYITICTKGRECLFGEIVKGKMELSDVGEIVLREWNESFNIRAELFCDCYVIMPNHIHGIVVIEDCVEIDVDVCVEMGVGVKMDVGVETHGRASLRDDRSQVATRPSKSISSFVAGFKSTVTKQVNEYRSTPRVPVWQPRFYDNIIRNNEDLCRIRKYIEDNPENWDEDDYHVVT